ncbi:U4/U6.U5 tri-snRNP-associated protein 2 [Tetranychus urticae]|uniref:Ubiquitin carboxyl-terminal hydrolase 39 n=1 Tax=Tetranychus urticae TaxID=32264 RepID=T1KF70_TETUR|nr:U4/U6.U5 tri-snRNP-associated protein 2 [Tetranychus urticae]
MSDISRNCPYLDTINRHLLDFDFEKLCSISLSKINVYACLVCGKYFQGRGIGTHAYVHSVATDHHVYLNLETLKFYCLPDNYEIKDSALDDITYVLMPTFSSKEIEEIDKSSKFCRAFDGRTYLPGIVGLNNIKHNDYCNVILQALSHVPPLRNYFLRECNYEKLAAKRPSGDNLFLLVQRFGELMRKLWNPRNFKAHVSPHEMLQAVVLSSQKKFQITEQGDPVEFMSWFLNSLHIALGGKQKTNSSIIYKTFRGSMKVYSRKIIPLDKSIDERLQLMLQDEYKEVCADSNFLYLTLDLPPQPLFKDELRENIIPQIPLFNLLAKFNGVTETENKTYKESFMRRFEITQLPKYLILYMKRFTKNTFYIEKNPTIVNFPIKDVDLTELLSPAKRTDNIRCHYDLIANIVHEGEPDPGKGAYRIHVLHRGSGKWFEMQDLHVTEILPQMITLSESYIQIWEKVLDGPEMEGQSS